MHDRAQIVAIAEPVVGEPLDGEPREFDQLCSPAELFGQALDCHTRVTGGASRAHDDQDRSAAL
jgi:hypothetical protein